MFLMFFCVFQKKVVSLQKQNNVIPMKAKLFLLLLCTILLSACKTPEQRNIAKLQKFTTTLQQEASTYTDADWAASIDEYELLIEEMSNGRYTDEERREIGRLKGQCVAIYSKSALQIFKNDLRDAVNEFEGALEGFLEVFE